MSPYLPSPRAPRCLKEFARWFRASHSRFLYSIEFRRISNWRFKLAFTDLPGCLQVSISEGEIDIWVEWDDETFDLLASFDVHPIKGPSGTVECKLCSPREAYSNPRALLKDHVYEPFLQWSNEKLHPAHALALYRNKGCTWAMLIQPGAVDDERDCLQVLVHFRRMASSSQDSICHAEHDE